MRIRELESGDLGALTEFIHDVYNEYPSAMWFEKEPSDEEIGRVFYNKMRGVGLGMLVDMVVDDMGTIAGECEITRVAHERGVVGILVRGSYRHRRMGSRILDAAVNGACSIGMRRFDAEVAQENEGAIKFFMVNGFAPCGYRDIVKGGKEQRFVVMQLEKA